MIRKEREFYPREQRAFRLLRMTTALHPHPLPPPPSPLSPSPFPLSPPSLAHNMRFASNINKKKGGGGDIVFVNQVTKGYTQPRNEDGKHPPQFPTANNFG